MATPQSTTSHEDTNKKNLEQITFRFCSECSNMLYPKEDEDSHKLQFTCRTCQYTEEATSTCVFRNVLNNAAGETAGVTQDVGSDPTAIFCLTCGKMILCTTCGKEPAITYERANTDPSEGSDPWSDLSSELRDDISTDVEVGDYMSSYESFSDCYDEEMLDEDAENAENAENDEVDWLYTGVQATTKVEAQS